MSSVLACVPIYLFVFGAITIAGGVVGFVKAKSRASLIAGVISGGLLIVAGWLAGGGSRLGPVLGLAVSVALARRFGVVFAKTKKVMPAGLILVLAIGALALTATALVAGRG